MYIKSMAAIFGSLAVTPSLVLFAAAPIAVFTDGFVWHKTRIGRDTAQRMALALMIAVTAATSEAHLPFKSGSLRCRLPWRTDLPRTERIRANL